MESPFLHYTGVLRVIGLFLSGVCHQLPEHTLTTASGQMTLCARCTGTYWGAALMFLILWRQPSSRAFRLPPVRVMLLVAGVSLLWLVDGANSYLSFLTGRVWLYVPNNALRLATGLGFGLALGGVVWPLFNASLWRDPSSARVLSSRRELGMALAGADILWLTLQADGLIPGLLVGAIDAIVVILVLTVVNTMIVLVAMRRENQAERWSEAVVPLSLGLLLAIAEVTGIALLRHFLVLALP